MLHKNGIDITSDHAEANQTISVVVPVYRNKHTLFETCEQILAVHHLHFPHFGLEIIFVDDGSADDSWSELLRCRDSYPKQICLVKLTRNFGQIFAILAGYAASNGAAVITISADLQDPVMLMADMVSSWQKGQDIVIAHRESRDDDIAATLFSKIAYGIARRANPRIPAGGFDYFLLSRNAVDLLLSFKNKHRFFQGDVLWLGLPTTFIPYKRERRKSGKSTWTFKKKFKYFIDLLLDSSYFPIRMMSVLGILITISGLIYSAVIVVARILGRTPFSGWAPIMIAILLTGGMIMAMLGVIGEYIWRMYDEIKQRPLYIIEKRLPPAQR